MPSKLPPSPLKVSSEMLGVVSVLCKERLNLYFGEVLGSASVALERSVLTRARESSKPKWWYERSVLGLDCNFLKQMSAGYSSWGL